MKTTISLIALLAAMTLTAPAFAQVAVDVGAGVSASAPGVDVSAGADASASTSSSAASTSSSSEMSNSASSASGQENGCSDTDEATVTTAPMDAGALDAVTSVTVLSTEDCSGLSGLSQMDGDIDANAQVTAALAAAGQTNSEIVGYVLDGTSLTVYVRNSK